MVPSFSLTVRCDNEEFYGVAGFNTALDLLHRFYIRIKDFMLYVYIRTAVCKALAFVPLTLSPLPSSFNPELTGALALQAPECILQIVVQSRRRRAHGELSFVYDPAHPIHRHLHCDHHR